MAGPAMNAACLTYEGINVEVETFPRTKDDVWLLGKHYNLDEGDLHYLNNDIRTRLWFTYRKNFPNIGGTGPTTDSGWGCMLRCGQMMLAQALICRHLGRDWRWDPDVPREQRYTQILQAFLDKKDSLYSLHQIAQMGVSEGKPVGSWFGPNTVVQVIKKLSAFDDWSGLSVHVAMDNTIIIEDIKKLCKQGQPRKSCGQSTCYDCTDAHRVEESLRRRGLKSPASKANQVKTHTCKSSWRPLVLFLPLRLGLSEMNPVYSEPFKACFTFRQSLGVIGGKPNHATYFIGYYGNNLLYLDPHSTQPTINPQEMTNIPDGTYHCVYPCRMSLTEVDPSVAMGFFCKSEEDFDDLCQQFKKHIIEGKRRPMFELAAKRPPHWPVLELPSHQTDELNSSCQSDFTELSYEEEEEREYDTEGEYEII
ncbi:cysteine protease ATG4B [Exaiptasia diaphana]|uniref:Cysteine protease n=1 Tax=Exaiptasia diaphana TaxID=2652724 RepID=A0A913WZD2_EXADI|nr:cysteine protease ATG4B [Exaiptasia diaphana]KXJ16560.1 Cysteine protease ATG4B [Exaiptasia diaphana]